MRLAPNDASDPLVAAFALLGPTAIGVQGARAGASAPDAWLVAVLLALLVVSAAGLRSRRA